MRDPQLAAKLNQSKVAFPANFEAKMFALTQGKWSHQITRATVDNLKGVQDVARRKKGDFTAMHVMAVVMNPLPIITKGDYTPRQIVEYIDLVPQYLEVLLTDRRTCDDAIRMFKGETSDIRERVSRLI